MNKILNPDDRNIYRIIVERSFHGIMLIDNNSTFVDANSAACNILGYSKDELLKMKVEDITPLNNLEIGKKLWQELLDKGKQKTEYYLLRKDGIKIIVEYVAIANISPDLHLFIIDDITKSKRIADKLNESLTIINKSHAVAFTWKNAEGWPVEFVSENVEKLFGYSDEDFSSGRVSYASRIHPDDLLRVSKEISKFSDEKDKTEFVHEPYRIITKSGHVKFVSDWSFIFRNPEGIITHYKGLVEDITERKIAEERLKSSNKQLEDIIEFLPDATFIIDKDKKIIAWNRAMKEMTGIPKEDILGKDRSYGAVPFYGKQRAYLIDLIFEPDPEIYSKYDFVKKKGKSLYVEVFTPALYNGKGAYVWAIASPLLDAYGNVIGAIESIRDINEFKMAEKALRESEEKYRTLFEDSKNPIWMTSREGIILDANQATADLLGYLKDELIGLDINYLYVDPSHRKIFQAEIEEKGFVKNFQSQWITKDGHQLDLLFDFTLWKDNDGKIMGYRGIAEDVTLINISQKQLGENLEYFAHLVDHIRNPLAILSGFTQVEIENEKTKDRLMRQIARIEEIIKQLDQGWMDTEDTRKFMKRYM